MCAGGGLLSGGAFTRLLKAAWDVRAPGRFNYSPPTVRTVAPLCNRGPPCRANGLDHKSFRLTGSPAGRRCAQKRLLKHSCLKSSENMLWGAWDMTNKCELSKVIDFDIFVAWAIPAYGPNIFTLFRKFLEFQPGSGYRTVNRGCFPFFPTRPIRARDKECDCSLQATALGGNGRSCNADPCLQCWRPKSLSAHQHGPAQIRKSFARPSKSLNAQSILVWKVSATVLGCTNIGKSRTLGSTFFCTVGFYSTFPREELADS